MEKAQILLLEDSPTLSAIYAGFLVDEPYELMMADSGQKALDIIHTHCPRILLLDLNLPDMEGMDILKYIHKENLPIVVVILTAHGSVDVAVDAMRFGAFDFISKPVEPKRLLITLRNAINNHTMSRMIDEYRENFERQDFCGLIGTSMVMQGVYRIIESAAPSNATVFITGESGTGKELCAEAVHQLSARKDGAFIALNCAAIPKDLIESEIFGHVKGAFTGASSDRKGAAMLADGGTLFLDELCEMDIDLQSKILRFIQSGTFQKVGSSRQEKVDVRFVCATNREPLKEVQEGRFREDLYYRLHVIPVALPALKERGKDILEIAKKLLIDISNEENKFFKRFGADAERILLSYSWPGNVRELENVIRNLVVLNTGEVVHANMLPPPLNSITYVNGGELSVTEQLLSSSSTIDDAEQQTLTSADANCQAALNNNETIGDIIPLWLVEKRAIESAIDYCSGNIPKAAAMLDVSPSTIYRKKQAWEE
ncbi:sigma-54-dependent Fis family transcriptional regulator [Thalassotalea sp. M1531]|uniref:Sigma-54-dependent Fis family transcriptional regulator n=1 Tax=Thalassotalea algicola TaxID=2716224 RepID=A0A7Y0Q6K4_9GAMM|nr:sigma-54 dependent transcriptional regulator [Thalassotalea algicola]NMP32104.1 sigma-54-dependent Fis family transcriptional regulator [Thalassotalea algicola]